MTSAKPVAESSSVVMPPERALPSSSIARAEAGRTIRIGEVADRLGLSLRSIRYYDETGLVTPTARTSGGFRLYSEADVQRLLLIMQMKPLDFTLEQMREVLDDLSILAGGHAETPEGAAPSASEQAAARERLARVSVDVEERYASARQRLEIASMFRDHLSAELWGATSDDSP